MATSWTGWSREQEEVLARAERLRAFGAHQAAQDVIAQEVPWPARMSMQRVLETGQQDVRRWYRAYTGVEWDGRLQSVQNARDNARRRRPAGARTEPWREGPHQGYGAFRTSHLLVDPLDSHPRLSEVRDYTRRIGWPAGSHVGTLAWDEPAALHCVFCDAVLLPSEAIDIDGTAGCVAGKMCCMSGYIYSFSLSCYLYSLCCLLCKHCTCFVWQEGASPCHARMAFVAKAVVVGMARTSTWRRGTDTVCSAQI